MIKIYLDKNIKTQFEKEGLSYPYLKSTKKYGVRGSTLLDTKTIEEAERNILNYLSKENIIKVIDSEIKVIGNINRDCPVCGTFADCVVFKIENQIKYLCKVCYNSKYGRK